LLDNVPEITTVPVPHYRWLHLSC